MPISKAEQARRRHILRNRDGWKEGARAPEGRPAEPIPVDPPGISKAEAARRRHIERNRSGRRQDAARSVRDEMAQALTPEQAKALVEAFAALPDVAAALNTEEPAELDASGDSVRGDGKTVYRADHYGAPKLARRGIWAVGRSVSK